MNRRLVMLDPDGTAPAGWMHVIVRAPTGVVYQQQYGGTATLLGEVEGYLVPVHDHEALATLRSVFERDLRGAGTSGAPLAQVLLDRVRQAVSQVRFWQHDDDHDQPHQLVLDDSRLRELDEAWIPVRTPHGPGYLVWSNSD
jgi:Family of unknown function (DUF6210)